MRRAARALGELAAVLFLVSLGVFLLVTAMPGDPAVMVLGEGHPPEAYDEVRSELGLDRPVFEQYLDWLASAVTGDLGTSLVPPQHEVAERLLLALPVSLQLAAMALVIALAVAIPLAMWSAHHEGGRIDRAVSAGTFGVLSVPPFLAGLLLIMVFAGGLGWFPRAEWARLGDGLAANLHHALLPALTIALMELAQFTRVLRNDLTVTLREDHILASRARGRSPVRVLVSDALRPSSFSLVTLLGLSVGRLIGSTVVVEYLFSLPGVGSLVVGAANQGDVPTVQGAVLAIAVFYVLANAAIDLSYRALDPRIRRSHV
ncbi:ABC transporter permease [Nocardiopsis sp. HNM0947]|uniref:ABC transporter permease n=1 Tax=Nocardiopsis coralli TaxID=2772213 RepID=A0ABR9NZS1_9ACTN|nr:ABC transporter permease [Nocardiopsis coralli]MBE2997090.1 ABC transporter permease [Nocardiopsis coralli]